MSERPRFRAVLFDWNGTLNDMSVVREQDKRVGREVYGIELTDDDIYAAWGKPPALVMPALFGRGGDTRSWEEMRRIFFSYDHLFPRRLRPDALDTLDVLEQAGIVTGVVTSGLQEKVLGYMRQMGLASDRFSILHTHTEIGDDFEAGRPILTRALGELATMGILPSEVLFVGDETVTMHDADAAGVDYAVVLGGTFSRQRLLAEGVPPEKVIESLHQLPGILGIEPPIT
jgi:phosphoglycolate phosphatase-like HAD superfamily hydrolase